MTAHGAALLFAALAQSAPSAPGDGPARAFPDSTHKIVQLTGDFDATRRVATRSRTAERAGVAATDLGSSFEHKGKLWFLFGDTIGGPKDADAIAWSDADAPERLELSFVSDGGKFRPIAVPGVSLGAFEIPSHGISVGGRMFVVVTTDHSRENVMGRSVLAASDDDGRTFQRLRDFSRERFINVALARATRADFPGLPIDDGVLVWGSGRYRASSPRLACAPASKLADAKELRYFAGVRDGEPRWSPSESESVDLFDHPVVGEISVAWIGPLKRWVMLYNSSAPRGIVMRSAPAPWGPWSSGEVIFDPWRDRAYGTYLHASWKDRKLDAFHDAGREDVWGGEYGPFLIERFTRGDTTRCAIHYVMSTWNPYQVVVMRTDLGYPNRLPSRELAMRTLVPGDAQWTTHGAPLVRFTRKGVPHASTFGAGLDSDLSVSHVGFACGADAALELTVHGGRAEVVLALDEAAPPSRIADVPAFYEALKAGRYGAVVEAVAGPSSNDVDVPVRWNLARHAGRRLRLYVIDALTGPWGFVSVSEIALKEARTR